MDLILLKPGDKNLAGDSLIDGSLADGNNDDLSGCIELISMHFGMKQQITTDVSNAARTSGRPILNDLTFVKNLDKTSPLLYKACLTAKPIGAGDDITRIFILRNGNDSNEVSVMNTILAIELSNAIVSAIETQSHPNDMTTEQVTLNFTVIKWIYCDDVAGSNVEYAWSVARNRGL